MPMFSDLPSHRKEEWNRWKEGREDQLLRQIENATSKIGQYLVLTNGGSVVAVTAFMGASVEVRDSMVAWQALQSFLLGLVLAGLYLGFTYHYFVMLFSRLKTDVYAVYSDKLDVDAVHQNDDRRAKASWIGATLAYLSFLCFLFGAYSGVYKLPILILR